ncbi:MAG: hypothetical protein AAFX99_05795 [Myxococcota bacterium]
MHHMLDPTSTLAMDMFGDGRTWGGCLDALRFRVIEDRTSSLGIEPFWPAGLSVVPNPSEVGSREVGVREVGSQQIALLQADVGEIGSREVGLIEIGF